MAVRSRKSLQAMLMEQTQTICLLVAGHALRDASSGDRALQASQSMLAQKKLTMTPLSIVVSAPLPATCPYLIHGYVVIGLRPFLHLTLLYKDLKHKDTRRMLFKSQFPMGDISPFPRHTLDFLYT